MGILAGGGSNFYYRLRDVITPGLGNSQYLYKEKLKSCFTQDSKWLDLGCGHQFLSQWMPFAKAEEEEILNRCQKVVGIDYEFGSVKENRVLRHKLVGDINRLPFRKGSFNVITANMVVEHLKNPALFLKAISSVLEPGGIFVFHTPNLLNYAILVSMWIPEPLKSKLIFFRLMHLTQPGPTYSIQGHGRLRPYTYGV